MRRLVTSIYEIKWAIASQVILSVGAFSAVVILSRFLDRNIFGEIRYIAAVLAILSLFSLPGANSVILRDTSLIGRKRVIEILKNQFKWSLIATSGALFFSLFYFIRENASLGYGFLIGGIFAPLANQYQMPGHIFAGLRRFRSKAFIDGMIMFAITLGATLGTLLTHSVPGTLFFYFSAQSIATSVLLLYSIKSVPKENAGNDSVALDMTHSGQLTIFQAPFTLLPALEKVLVFLFLGPSFLAVFTIAVLPIEHMRAAFRNLLQFLVLPNFGNGGKTPASLKKWIVIASILTVGGIIILLAFIKIILPIFFPQYLEVVPLSLVLVLALIPVPIQILILDLIASRKIRDLLLYAGSLTIVNVVTFLIFIPLFGLMGAVVAKVVTEFVTATLLGVFYKNSNKL